MSNLFKRVRSRICLAGLAAGVFCITQFQTVNAASFYFDIQAGSYGPGTQSSPWKSVDSINKHPFNAGDSIHVKRGDTIATGPSANRFTASEQFNTMFPVHQIYGILNPQGSGKKNIPITLDAYGSGPNPIINAAGLVNTAGILLYNQKYWTIQNMEVWNNSTIPALYWGIFVGANNGYLDSSINLLNNTIKDIYGDPSDGWAYRTGGIFVEIDESSHMDGLLIQGNQVLRSMGQGISFEGESWGLAFGMSSLGGHVGNWNNLSTNIIVRGNTVVATHGQGIMLWGTNNEIIEYNYVDGTGQIGQPTGNVNGIWPAVHKNGLMQYNEVSHTRLGDGGGLHTDDVQSGTFTIQYNYSHDNEGPFISTAWPDCNDQGVPKTIVRYNISQNDNTSGSSFLIGLCQGGTDFYNNTIYGTGSIIFTSNFTPPACNPNLKLYGINSIRNNIFCGFSSATWDLAENTYDYNCYDPQLLPPTGEKNVRRGDYTMFTGPGVGPSGYRLLSGSCINSGVPITTNNNVHDFWGTPLYIGQPDIGAFEGTYNKFGLTGDVAIEKIPATGQMACFAVGTDNTVLYRIQYISDANNKWPAAWNSLGGTVTGPIAAIKGSDNALYVFAKNPTNSSNILTYRRLPFGSNVWDNWKPLSSVIQGGSKIAIGSKIAVASYSDNNIAIFAKSTNNHLYRLNQTGSNTFSLSWTPMGSNVAIGNNIVIGMVSGQYLQLFANSGNTVVSLYQTVAGSGGAWTSDYQILPSNASDGLAVGNNLDGTLQIFTTSSSTGVIATSYRTSSGWTAWQNMPGLSGTYAGQNMTCAKNPDGRLELFFWGYKGSFAHMYQLSANNGYMSWSGITYFQYSGGSGSNFIGAINNAASTWNISLFVNNGININSFYQNCNYYDCWAPPFLFNN